MRKTRNNDDLIRMHKTPSPSAYTQLRPSLLIRNASKQTQPYLVNDFKPKQKKQKAQTFQSYLVNIKDKEKQVEVGDQNKEGRARNTRKIHTRNQTSPNIDTNPYNLGQVDSKIICERRGKLQESDRESSRKNSVTKEASEKSELVGSTKNSYQETIRRLANQNIRLRHECKVMQERFEKMIQERKGDDNLNMKSQADRVIKAYDQLVKKQSALSEENKNLKEALATNNQELSQSNYEIYKMKQEIFQLKLTIQKLENKKREKSVSNLKAYNTEKNLPVPVSCKSCKSQTSTINQLINRLQQSKLQLGEQKQMEKCLCTEIGRLQSQLKQLQKPRQLYRKYNSIINDLSEQIMNERAKELSYKYMKIATINTNNK